MGKRKNEDDNDDDSSSVERTKSEKKQRKRDKHSVEYSGGAPTYGSRSQQSLNDSSTHQQSDDRISATNAMFWSKTIELSTAVLPSGLKNLTREIEDGLASLLLKYSSILKGVLISYDNVQILDDRKGMIINELPHIHYRVLADAVVFAPEPGAI